MLNGQSNVNYSRYSCHRQHRKYTSNDTNLLEGIISKLFMVGKPTLRDTTQMYQKRKYYDQPFTWYERPHI